MGPRPVRVREVSVRVRQTWSSGVRVRTTGNSVYCRGYQHNNSIVARDSSFSQLHHKTSVGLLLYFMKAINSFNA